MRLNQRQKTVVLVIVVVVIILWAVFNPTEAKNDVIAILDSFWETIKDIARWIVSPIRKS